MKKEYRKPTGRYIGGASEKLYKLEEQSNALIKACAKEQGTLLGFKEGEFWTHAMPEALLSVLNSFDKNAARLAAEAYLNNLEVIHEKST